MSSDLAIRAAGLGKRYRIYQQPQDRLKELIFPRRSFGRDFWALQDVDFEIRRGETLGIVGRNGSGKSTLLQLVCGTIQPTAGELEVHGRVAALLELGAGFNPDFTGRENVYLSATVLGLSQAEIDDRFQAIEAFAEIGEFIDQPVRRYSSGMYARLAFAVCAHVDADIFVVDEILAVGDAGFQQRCMRFLNAFRARGTLLFVSHDEASVLSLCDRALWLERGTLRASGAARDVCRRYRIHVAQSNSGGESFQTGGRVDGTIEEPNSRDNTTRAFDFNLDGVWSAGEGLIEQAELLTPEGDQAIAVEGGEIVTLRVDVLAKRELQSPIIGFVVRNRLGQVIISDNTSLLRGTPSRVPVGRRLGATFTFALPHLPSGDYAIEPALFERDREGPVDQQLDKLFVRVNSNPALEGLANLSLSRVWLDYSGAGQLREIGDSPSPELEPVVEDARWQGRNPMQVLPFNREAPWHGSGGARITDAGFFSIQGEPLRELQGGKEVELRIAARTDAAIDAPIIGFMLRNSLGQIVCGHNTFEATKDHDRRSEAGEVLTGHFRFQVPYLPSGDYALAPSIIDGVQSNHVQLHWVEEAMIIRVKESPVVRSVIGVPMRSVALQVERMEDRADTR
jgi:lipopolysaccharide transport system ATP-binding protein